MAADWTDGETREHESIPLLESRAPCGWYPKNAIHFLPSFAAQISPFSFTFVFLFVFISKRKKKSSASRPRLFLFRFPTRFDGWFRDPEIDPALYTISRVLFFIYFYIYRHLQVSIELLHKRATTQEVRREWIDEAKDMKPISIRHVEWNVALLLLLPRLSFSCF